MPTFDTEAGGKTFEVEAPDMQTAARAAAAISAAENTDTTNIEAKNRKAVDVLFASVAAEFAIGELTAGRPATLDDLRRVLRETFEERVRQDFAVALDTTQHTRLLDVIDSYVARSADTFVAAGVRDTRRTGLYI